MIVYPILPPGLFWNSSFFGAFVVLELFILVLYAYWLPTICPLSKVSSSFQLGNRVELVLTQVNVGQPNVL